MRELAGRMQSVDRGAGAALQVVAHFDALVEARARAGGGSRRRRPAARAVNWLRRVLAE